VKRVAAILYGHVKQFACSANRPNAATADFPGERPSTRYR